MFSGRNLARGTERMALITFGVWRMSSFIRLSMSLSQSFFSNWSTRENIAE
jgi:hypothetical protein